jgi:hypothetical protein
MRIRSVQCAAAAGERGRFLAVLGWGPLQTD